MKAAILNKPGEAPRCGEYPEPIVQNEDQVLISVHASSVKNLDKARASGAHYSASSSQSPQVVGFDGVGTLADGTRVYAMGITGMMAEKALINKHNYVKLPDGVDDITAAALPNAVMGAASALRFRAEMKEGDTVLINGATGVTGSIAIQAARVFGAKKIIAVGRNQKSLEKLLTLGAHQIVSLNQDDGAIIEAYTKIHTETPVDVVIDYLWGHPAELIFKALHGNGMITHPTRYVNVGAMAGDIIPMSSGFLRSTNIRITGSGIGSLPGDAVRALFSDLIPEMMNLAAEGKISIDTVTAPLEDIEPAWNMPVEPGKRLVIVI